MMKLWERSPTPMTHWYFGRQHIAIKIRISPYSKSVYCVHCVQCTLWNSGENSVTLFLLKSICCSHPNVFVTSHIFFVSIYLNQSVNNSGVRQSRWNCPGHDIWAWVLMLRPPIHILICNTDMFMMYSLCFRYHILEGILFSDRALCQQRICPFWFCKCM